MNKNPIHYYCLVDKDFPSSQKKLKKFTQELERLHNCKFTFEEFDARKIEWVERNKKFYASDSYVYGFTNRINQKYGKEIDAVLFFVSDDNWKQGAVRLRGFKLGRIFNGYYATFTRYRSDYAETGEHEILHFIDEYIKANIGVSLESKFGVQDFDDDIVHSPLYWKQLNYKYDEVWNKILTNISDAVFARRSESLMNQIRALQIAVAELMKRLGILKWESHSIPEIEIQKHHTTKHYNNGLKGENAIIGHIDLGTEAGTINEIVNGTRSASYHWYIPRHAKYVVEFVPQDKAAWHAGVIHEPVDEVQGLFGGEDGNIDSGEPNWYSYGICYEGLTTSTKPTDAQIKLAVELVKYKKLDHLPWVEHWKVTSYKPKIVTEFVEGVQKLLGHK